MNSGNSSTSGQITVTAMNGASDSYPRPVSLPANATLGDLAAAKGYNLATSNVSVIRQNGSIVSNPGRDFRLTDGDAVSVVLGKQDGGSGASLLSAVQAALTLSRVSPEALTALGDLGEALASRPDAVKRIASAIDLFKTLEEGLAQVSAATPNIILTPVPAAAPVATPAPVPAQDGYVKVVVAGSRPQTLDLRLTDVADWVDEDDADYRPSLDDCVEYLEAEDLSSLDLSRFHVLFRDRNGAIVARNEVQAPLVGGEQIIFHPKS
jgi:hypothetical protein